jgi:hypothetical protein
MSGKGWPSTRMELSDVLEPSRELPAHRRRSDPEQLTGSARRVDHRAAVALYDLVVSEARKWTDPPAGGAVCWKNLTRQ